MAGRKGRSGTNGKGKTGTPARRTAVQREVQRDQMMKLLIRGWTKSQIAEEFGVHKSQISYDYKVILKEVIEDREGTAEEHIAFKLREYAELKREAWEAWERSKLDQCSETREEYLRGEEEGDLEEGEGEGEGEGGGKKSKPRTKLTRVIKGRVPGVEYLKLIAQCMEREQELMGISQPQQINVSTVNWEIFATVGHLNGSVSDPIEDAIANALKRSESIMEQPHLSPELVEQKHPILPIKAAPKVVKEIK